jgi:hypothetical protein
MLDVTSRITRFNPGATGSSRMSRPAYLFWTRLNKELKERSRKEFTIYIHGRRGCQVGGFAPILLADV